MGTVLPHRFALRPPAPRVSDEPGRCPDGDLVAVYAIVWAGAAVRVALARHETFGVELTLALSALVVLPLLLKAPLRWLLGRPARTRAPREEPRLAEVRRLLPTIPSGAR